MQDNVYDYEDADGYVDDDDEEIPLAERELAEDAQWKIIQKNTFTRWANQHLKPSNQFIEDLQFDLADGIKLVFLVQELSGSKFRRMHKKPNFRTQKLENITMVLRYLEESEGLRLVNIDSSDISDCRLKLILGLIWTLILHYSITMPLWEGEDQHAMDSEGKGPTPKQRLLGWINSKMPYKPIKNFTSDWKDGTAIGALVDACALGLCPNWSQWDPKQSLRNASEAMDCAEQHLNVPQLIQPNEMINPKVDEKAMMTYLSQFPNAKLSNNAPLRPKTNPTRVQAYGPGLELEGNMISVHAKFTVDAFNAGYGNLDIIVLNPKGQKEPCEIAKHKEKENAYSCFYIPKIIGEYRIIIKYAGSEIPNSPYKVNVRSPVGDPNEVVASGPGIEPVGNEIGRRTFFNVFTPDAGSNVTECVILDPNGKKDIVIPKITKQSEDKYLVEYTPKIEGLHSVNVFYSGIQISTSPYGVMVGPKSTNCDAKQAYATGRGIQPEGLRVSDLADFKVHTEDAGFGDLNINVYNLTGDLEKCQVRKTNPYLYDCSYVPQRPGSYAVEIKYGNSPIHQSPFNVEVGSYKESKIKAYGPGLVGGIVNKPAFFVVETNGETGSLGFSIKGPSEAKIDCVDNGDGSANVTYWPVVPGEYAVHILCDDENIPKSPYMAQIQPDNKLFDPLRVTAYGPGLNPGVQANKPADFTVDTRNAGVQAIVKPECFNNTGELIPVQIRDNNDGMYSCRYTPKFPGKHNVIVSYGGVNIPKSPFRVDVMEPSNTRNIKVYGPGIEKAKMNSDTFFIVDCTNAGPGDIGISVLDEKSKDVPVVTDDNGDGRFKIKYTPRTCGPKYIVQVFFSEVEISQSPFKVTIESDFDLRKYSVNNLNSNIPIGQLCEFDILTPREVSKVKPEILIQAPNGLKIPTKLRETIDGFSAAFVPTMTGLHTVSVAINGVPIGNSPYKVNVTDSIDFIVYPEEDESLALNADFDSDNMAYKKSHLYTAKTMQPIESVNTCSYSNTAQQSDLIESSNIKRPLNENFVNSMNKTLFGKPNIIAYGEGLISGFANKIASFIIDSSKEPPAPLGVTIEGPMEASINYIDNCDGTCGVNYMPKVPGTYIVNVLYNDDHIRDSPFTVPIYQDAKVSPRSADIFNVTAYGPGIDHNGLFKDCFAKFIVNSKPIDPFGKGIVKAILTNPYNQRSACVVENKHDGTYTCSYSPNNEGPHKVDISYDGIPLSKSPYLVPVFQGCDPSRIRAYGPGLEKGITNQLQLFTVDLDGAGQGGLGLTIEGPADTKIQCNDNKDGTCSVSYYPTKAGSYDVSIKFNESNITGSPFHVPIHDQIDTNKVRCYGPGIEPHSVRVNKSTEFIVDASKAGEAQLQVNVKDILTGKITAGQILPRATQGIYDVSYLPENVGNYDIEVKYDNCQVPGSPFRQCVLTSCEPEKVVVTGEGVRPCRGFLNSNLTPSIFTVNTKDAGEGDLELMIVGPKGEAINLEVDNHDDGTFTCQYIHKCPGSYTIKVIYGDRNVNGSPFVVPVYSEVKPEQCFIEGQVANEVPVGKTVTISVNTQSAGDGVLLANIIGPTGISIPCSLDNERYGHSTINYIPQQPGLHEIQIMFNDQQILSGSIRQQAIQLPEQYKVDKATRVYRTEKTETRPIMNTEFSIVDFKFPIGPVFDYVSALVNCPSKKKDRPRLTDNGDGTITVQYQPHESGLHDLEVLYNGKPISGSPFKFIVECSTPSGIVTAYGPGLSYGRPDVPAHFTIVAKDAGAGGLSLAVEGPSKAEIQCFDNKDCTCDVSYLPLVPGDYHISIKFMDKHIVGSPFNAKIFGEPCKRSQICVGTTSDVPLKISETDIHNLTSIVCCPSGKEESCSLKRLPNGYLGISFTPKEVGEHLVNVLRSGRHIPNSPFKIFVGEHEIGNASRVRLYGDGLREGMTNDQCQFIVDTREAGYGGLSLSIEGPSKAEIECQDNHDGTCVVTYKPTEPGTYIINIKYADERVPGSPFVVNIGGQSAQRIMRHQEAADVSQIGNVCELNLIIPGYSNKNITSSVTSPSGAVEYCELLSLSDNQYTIRFMPRELGVHTVSVKADGHHVPGSPFQFTVGPLVDGGPHKVQVTGLGIERGLSNDANEFTIYTREAGAGSLSIAIEGPSKADIDFKDNKDGSCGVIYRVCEPGDYVCSIKFNDEHVSGSPFSLQIDENLYSTYTHPVRNENIIFNETLNMSIAALQDQGLTIGSRANFVVNYHGLTDGNIRAFVISPSNREQPATISKIDSDQYSVNFVPIENGVHLVHLLLNNVTIPGSPFRVIVGEVNVSGEGIRHGHTGKVNEFFVNTSHAGNGALTVTIDGPSKVQLNCQENENGYNFTYVPNVPGDYTISIKYGGNNNIIGSPFYVPVSGEYYHVNESQREIKSLSQTVHMMSTAMDHGPSKPHNVKCDGDGLKVAHVGKSNEFIVDAGLAGSDVLYVGVSGPVRPCEEVNIKHIGDNRFQVHYFVQERGRHLLMVRWGNQDVPGSPFEIYVP